MPKSVFPMPLFTSGYDPIQQRTIYQQTGASMGISVSHYYLGQILSGLAANPTTMLNIEDHLDYAIRLAEEAEKKTLHWSAY